MRALLGVYDKSGIEEFATGLVALGWDLVSTGGTFATLEQAGIPVRKVEDITGFPEMLDGRVKTLHPVVHGGILARRDLESHRAALAEHGIEGIDLVCCNLYPFVATVTKPGGVTFEDGIENIDIGGPTMLRAAAKNHRDVVVVISPDDYGPVLDQLKTDGNISSEARLHLAYKAFAHVAAYDS
ncbi:MAG TPA: bifunctional phosphoribosylaminoimidazolecarboxamide formyltransferase/IMP cyclohydrolase, partial [Tepidiformaceae bacterium]|nr:bifunctional phosphoribosylaminoimidazolecarboxamide formyltransferase/IMP cyclohydrolase [Tepidiformaceae bacterium]